MKHARTSTTPIDATKTQGFALRGPVVVIALGALALLGVVIAQSVRKSSRGPSPQVNVVAESAKKKQKAPEPPSFSPPSAPSPASPSVTPIPAVVTPIVSKRPIQIPPPQPAELPPTSAFSQQLITRLSQVTANRTSLTPEQAAEFKLNLKQIQEQGAYAVPAIRQFLEQNQDLNFAEAGLGNSLGYSSLREALFDGLKQIGGFEAQAAFLQTLQTTGVPNEIAQIARHLEDLAPGQYRQEVMNAVRETLAQAAQGQPGRVDAAPLFQTIQTYGDASVVPDLERAVAQWQYYATMALAGLPGPEGIAGLIRQVQDPAGGPIKNKFAFEMLAQVSTQSAEAAAALVEQARLNRIPDFAWIRMADPLAGAQYQIGTLPSGASESNFKTYHIAMADQNFYSALFPEKMTPEQIGQRQALIDQLLAVNTNPTAVRALQNARARLSGGKPGP